MKWRKIYLQSIINKLADSFKRMKWIGKTRKINSNSPTLIIVSFILCAALLLRKLGFDRRSLHRVTSPMKRKKTNRITSLDSMVKWILAQCDQAVNKKKNTCCSLFFHLSLIWNVSATGESIIYASEKLRMVPYVCKTYNTQS